MCVEAEKFIISSCFYSFFVTLMVSYAQFNSVELSFYKIIKIESKYSCLDANIQKTNRR